MIDLLAAFDPDEPCILAGDVRHLTPCEHCGTRTALLHTTEQCREALKKEIVRLHEVISEWKEAWFKQRAATGKCALAAYNLELKAAGVEVE